MYFCIRLAGKRMSMLFMTKGRTSHTVITTKNKSQSVSQVGFAPEWQWSFMEIFYTHQKVFWSSWQESPHSLKLQPLTMFHLDLPKHTGKLYHCSSAIYCRIKCQQIMVKLLLCTPCCTTDSGKRFRRRSSISAFSKVLKHCSVAFSSISHCTRPGSVSKSPWGEITNRQGRKLRSIIQLPKH